ncbi:hypothetical protein SI65_05564 [Aspergillus cristatus]|uniref:Protein kinase domain-containing protein n=1 Tax=Aspergillus cristatus TaxID=573508 RepID=A0A1E3BDD4_ASPCR|nr:hypothetical protein SI65_05564 [Aspergillus cristatus]
MGHEEAECPYAVGNIISLQLDASHNQQTVEAKITRVFEPFTLSCVMLVSLEPPVLGLDDQMVLKLFDRRFVVEFREMWGIDSWTPDIEQQFQQFVMDNSGSEFITRLKADDKLVDKEGDSWNNLQDEAWVHYRMQDFYNRETEVYHTMRDIQGKDIPRLFTSVNIPGSPSSRYTDVSGILVQYIDGFELYALGDSTPSQFWQSVCEDAIRIVRLFGNRGILNQDVNVRNFIVQKGPAGIFKPSMIDFATCRFRREYKDEHDWREWKSRQDEEGAVGFVMQRMLKGGYAYHRSAYYRQLDYEFKMDE